MVIDHSAYYIEVGSDKVWQWPRRVGLVLTRDVHGFRPNYDALVHRYSGEASYSLFRIITEGKRSTVKILKKNLQINGQQIIYIIRNFIFLLLNFTTRFGRFPTYFTFTRINICNCLIIRPSPLTLNASTCLYWINDIRFDGVNVNFNITLSIRLS